MLPRHLRLDIGSTAFAPIVQGSLDNSAESIRIAVPSHARVTGNRLEWIQGDASDPQVFREWWPEGAKASRALPAFLKLATINDPQKIVDFVLEFGVLGLGRNGLPVCGSMQPIGDIPHASEAWKNFAVSWEPIEGYWFYARAIKALVMVAVELKNSPNDHLVSVTKLHQTHDFPIDSRDAFERAKIVCEEWRVERGLTWEEWYEKAYGSQVVHNLHTLDPGHLAENLTYSPELHRHVSLEDYAKNQRPYFANWFSSHWLAISGLIPVVTWKTPQARMALPIGTPDGFERYESRSNSLFRLLMVHVASVICSGSPVATCDLCGDVYFPQTRKARTDQPHYCDACRPAAGAIRTRKWRQRLSDKANADTQT